MPDPNIPDNTTLLFELMGSLQRVARQAKSALRISAQV